jgi:hypothetical protein
MYRNKALQKGYTNGVAKMKENYGDAVGAKLSQAVGVLQLFDKG